MVPCEVRVNSASSKDEQIKKEARINVTAYQGKVLLVGNDQTLNFRLAPNRLLWA